MALLEIPSRRSFRRQIILTFVVGFFLLISAFAGFRIITERDNLHRDSVSETTSMAHLLSASALPWVLADDVAGLQEVVHAFRAYPEFSYAMIVSPDGRVLAHSDPSKMGMFLSDERSQALLKGPHEPRVMEDTESIIDVAVPIEINHRQVGWARVAATRKENAAYLRTITLYNVVFLLVSTILSLIAAMLIADRLGRRIGSLVQVAEGVQAGNVSARAITSGGEEEISRLGTSLNKMLDTLSQNEHDLRAASHYTRSLIEASLDPLVTISAEGKITDVNRATEKATGMSRTELVGTDFSDYFTEPEKAREGYLQVFARGFVTDFPLTLRHRDGHVTDVLYNASVYRDEAGKVLGVFAAARDITERKKSEEELAQLSLQNRLILDSAGEGIYGLDMSGRITFINPAASQMLGFGAGELVGQSSHATFHHTKPDGSPYPEEECPVHAAYKEGVAHRGSDLYWRKNGSIFPVEFISTPILEAEKLTGAVVTFRDITERKQAENALREKEERLSLATVINGVGIWDWNLRTQEMIWDDSMYALYHIRREDFIGTEEAWRKSLHPDDLERGDKEVADAMAGIKPFDTEFRVVWPNGEIRHIKAVAKVFRDAQGAPLRMLGTNVDITERKKTEEELYEAQQVFRALIENSPDIIARYDRDCRRTYVNPAYLKATQLAQQELLATAPKQLSPLPTASAEILQNLLRKVLNSGVAEAVDVVWPKGDIDYWYNIYAFPEHDREGQVVSVMTVSRDITERKQAEEELKERERHSQSLLRLSRDMERAQTYADVMNAARDEVRKILGYQNLWAYLFTEDKKYAKAIVASGPETDFIMSEAGTATLSIEGDRMLEEIAASKEIIIVADAQTDERVNKEIVTRMGNRTIVNIPIILFDRHFGCVGTGTFGEEGVHVPSNSEQKYLMALASHMAAALDRIHLLAERKLAEDEVKALNRNLEQRVAARTAELQAANKELEAFSYSVSHDLRSPLRAIDGFSHILLDDYSGKLDDEGKRLLNVVRNNTSKMGQLIDDILKFSRAGRLEMNFSEINMDELARDVYEELLPAAARQNLQVDIEPLSSSRGDRAMMRQVFVNLLSNAIKFTHGKAPAKIKVGAYTEKNETVYFVQDNGAGFDMRYVDRLFGVFQRLHTESEFEGTGIGLAIVKRIVARHGGRTWAEGKVNEGATIYFALPAAAAAPG
jgi:PAS domain S-box-containing protein